MSGNAIVVNRTMVAIVAAAVAILGVSAAISVQLYSPSAIPPTKSSAYSVNYTTGLALTTRISSEKISQGANISISVSVMNTLLMWNDLPPQSNYPQFSSPYVFSMNPCASTHYGIAVLNGNYSASNLDQASPLTINKPAIYSCPLMYHVGYYQFLPHSTHAKMYSSPSETTYLGTTDLSGSITLSGYWTGNLQDHVFNEFSPGTYTVVSADGWGQIGILHFTVL